MSAYVGTKSEEVVLFKYKLVPKGGIDLFHTSIGFCGKEISFSYRGIETREIMEKGEDREVISLGFTNKTIEDLMNLIYVGKGKEFSSSTYNLLKKNCINFSEFICRFLLDKGIPSYIVEQIRNFIGNFSLLDAMSSSSSLLLKKFSK